MYRKRSFAPTNRAASAPRIRVVSWLSARALSTSGAGAAHKRGSSYITRCAWPSARWGSLPLEGGIEAAYRSDIENSSDPKAELEKINIKLNKLRSPLRTAESFWIEEIIDPRNTKNK